MALLQVCVKIPEVKDRLISQVINGKKASGCLSSSIPGMVSDRQVVGFALVSSLLIALKVTSLKDAILGRSFRKVLGTLRQTSGLNDLHMVSILSWIKDAKPYASDAFEPGGTGFPAGSLVSPRVQIISIGHHGYPL